MSKRARLIILLSILFLSTNLSYLYAQEKVAAREEAKQRYREGKELYSQGRYQEATAEFEKAITLTTPTEMRFEERIQKEQGKAFTPGTSQESTIGFNSATTLVTPTKMQFEERVQKEHGRVFAPPPATAEATPTKKELVEKKKEEKKTEEGEAEVTGAVITPAPAPEAEDTQEEKEYYIDIGDVLDISVWQIPDLTRSEVIVRPDGKISFPLIGDIKAEGLTLTQLDNIITGKLKTYVKAPEVSIMIRRFGEQANKVVILGEIFGPGVYKFSGPPSIAEVIASAGGYTKYAVLNSIMVFRGDVRAKPEVTRVNFAKIIKSGRLSENIILKPNDIIYVPRSFIGNVNTFLEVFQPAISEYMQTMNARYLHNVMNRN